MKFNKIEIGIAGVCILMAVYLLLQAIRFFRSSWV